MPLWAWLLLGRPAYVEEIWGSQMDRSMQGVKLSSLLHSSHVHTYHALDYQPGDLLPSLPLVHLWSDAPDLTTVNSAGPIQTLILHYHWSTHGLAFYPSPPEILVVPDGGVSTDHGNLPVIMTHSQYRARKIKSASTLR